MALHDHKPEYVDTDDTVRYLDGSSLSRPFDLPRNQWLIAAVFLVAAIGIGGYFGFQIIDEVVNAPARAAASLEENLNRDVALDLPSLIELVNYSNEDIRASFDEAGYTIYDKTDEETAAAGVGFDLIKLPSDVSLEEAGLLYLQGVSNLSAADAAKLLNGSWEITVDRASGTDFRVRYADFASGTVDAAIQNAIIAEGLSDTTFGDSGVDGSGNTFQAGTVAIGDATYTWQVSACPLSGVYDNDGLPESAVYVGVRLYL
ncbi:teichoic acid transporter [Raoultibacter phocaeensis]|uniref:teichoic acid transporter n=1 Tax=Raoultibacter phocaeensis TaxID=2479841 RepID=UPI00111ADC04|nr:teichoic acid transporter [Raoultibacter phocaeensis]